MIYIRELEQSYNEEMLDILEKSPMRTNTLDLHFDKSPDIFLATRLWSDDFKYFGIFSENNLVGFGMYLIYTGFVDSRHQKILYIGNFCIDTNYRKRGFLFRLSEHIHREVPPGCKYGYCIILKGNSRAERYFDPASNLLSFLPSKRIKLAYETKSLLILGPKQVSPHFKVKQASRKDISLLNDFINHDYTPEFLMHEMASKSIENRLSFRKGLAVEDIFVAYHNNEIMGFCAAWDVSKYKRTRILKYKYGFRIIRLIYKLLSIIFHYPDLPKNGDEIKEIYITDLVIKGRNHLILESLLKETYNAYQRKKYNLINFSSYKDDPLLKATKSFFSTSLHSNIYFSVIGGNKNIDTFQITRPSIDIALL